jgi:hypothetical protein
MLSRKLIALMLVTGGFIALVPTNASAQEAQTITASIKDCSKTGDQTIRPLGAPGQWGCTLEVQWSGEGIVDPTRPVTVSVNSPTSISWANAIISPSSVTITPSTGQDGAVTETRDIDVRVSLLASAPAFSSQELTLEPQVTAEQEDEAQTTATSGTQLTITPAYFNLYNVRLNQKIQEASPDSSVTFPIQIDNFSNAQTRFEFSQPSAGGGEDGGDGGGSQAQGSDTFRGVTPSPLVIQSQAQGGEQTKDTATFQVFTPYSNGYVNRIGSLQLQIDSKYAVDTSETGAGSQVSTLTKVKGFYVPGPGGLLALLSVAGAALALTKRRNGDRWN